MFKLLFLLITILLINLIYLILLDIKFGKALPITLISFFFVAFISGALGNLSYYKYVLPCLLIIGVIIIWFRKNHIPSLKEIINKFFNVSFFLFIIFYFYLWFLYKNVGLNNIDDLFHWSLSVNTIVKSGTLFPVGWYINSYPPFVTWYISIICYILGGYSESLCLFALSNLCLSFIFPFLDKFSFKKKEIIIFFASLLSLILSLLCVNITENDQFVFVFNSIYIDWIMSILFAYLLFLVYDYSGKFNEAIYYSIVLSALVLTKQVSIPLSLVCIFALFIKQIINKNIKLSRLITIILFSVISYICWSLMLNSVSNSQTILGSLSTVSEASSTLMIGSSSKMQIVKNFIVAFFTKPIIFHPFKLSYFFFISILFIFLLVYGILNKKPKDYFSTNIIAFLGSFGYGLVLLFSYLVVFSDGYSLPLFTRYMQTYTFAYLLLCVYLVLKENKLIHTIVLLVAIILFIEPNSINTLFISSKDRFYKPKEREKINQYIADIYNNEKIGILSQTNMKYKNSVMFMFYDNHKFENISFIQVFNQYDNNIDELKDFFSKFEYLLIIDHDTTLSNYWKQITDTPLYNSTIYKIDSTSNDINIHLVEIFEDTNTK